MIVIFGPPGSGKTTQVELLRGDPEKYLCLGEPTEDVLELVNDVYLKVPGAAFKLQMHVLESRCRGYREAETESTKCVVGDGHVLSDFAMYASPRISGGEFSESEKRDYMQAFLQATCGLDSKRPFVDLFIYLKIGRDEAACRVALRDSLGEKDIDRETFVGFVDRAEQFVATLDRHRLMTLDGTEEAAVLHEKIKAAIAGLGASQFE